MASYYPSTAEFAMDVRNVLTSTLISASRECLKEIFGGSCHRTAKICAVLDAARFSTERAGDPRLQGCRNACESVEQVLKDLGLGAALRAAQEEERQALAKACLGDAGGDDARSAEEEAAKKAAEEETARKAAEEEAARRAAEEEAARKAAEEEAAKKAAEEGAAKKAAEEGAAKKAAEEGAAKRQLKRKQPSKAARRGSSQKAARREKAAEEEAARKAAEEAARKAAEEEAARKAAEEEAARKAVEEEAARKAAEEAAREAAEEEAAKAAARRPSHVAGGKGKGKAKGAGAGIADFLAVLQVLRDRSVMRVRFQSASLDVSVKWRLASLDTESPLTRAVVAVP
eukprot:symbB.v1.2.014878.t1/scaffold1098.1/size138148/10